jgi:hypothetical protein
MAQGAVGFQQRRGLLARAGAVTRYAALAAAVTLALPVGLEANASAAAVHPMLGHGSPHGTGGVHSSKPGHTSGGHPAGHTARSSRRLVECAPGQ